MTPGNQRIAIAEACGEWSWWLWGRDQFVITAPRNIRLTWSGEDKATNSMRCPLNGQSLDEAARDLMLRIIPDYLGDLNACAQFEKTLNEGEQREYLFHLCKGQRADDGELWLAVHKSAPQRCEAFLKTKGLWVEEPVSAATVEGLR